MTMPNWTKELPSVPGYYWFRDKEYTYNQIALVRSIADPRWGDELEWKSLGDNQDDWDILDTFDGIEWWSIPIMQPD